MDAPHDSFRGEVAAAFEEVEGVEPTNHGGQPLADAGIEASGGEETWIGHSCHEPLSIKWHRRGKTT
jgi:hypothetical protein